MNSVTVIVQIVMDTTNGWDQLVGGGVVFFILGMVRIYLKSESQRIRMLEVRNFLKRRAHMNDVPPQTGAKQEIKHL